MITIESLVDMGANVRLEVTPTDLKMFAESGKNPQREFFGKLEEPS